MSWALIPRIYKCQGECGKYKPVTQFPKNSKRQFKIASICSVCHTVQQRKIRRTNTYRNLQIEMQLAPIRAGIRLIRESERALKAAAETEPYYYKKFLQEEIDSIKAKTELRISTYKSNRKKLAEVLSANSRRRRTGEKTEPVSFISPQDQLETLERILSA